MSHFDESYRILRSFYDDPDGLGSNTIDFKIASDLLKASGTLGILAGNASGEGDLKFTSTDGVIPLVGESPDDVGLLVKWFTRAKGFALDEDNTTTLIRLSDKYDIESLRCEINVYYAFWLFADKIKPTYSLWEMAAIHGLEDVERYCRASAREKFKRILEEGDGLKYFLRLGISADTLTTLIKEVYSRARPRPLKAEDIVLQQMAMAQL